MKKLKVIPRVRRYGVPDEERQNNSFDFIIHHGQFEPREISQKAMKRIKLLLTSSCNDELKHTYTVIIFRIEEDAFKVVCSDLWVDKKFLKGVKIYDKKKKSEE